ncbi:C4-dicarboxylate ABC transporter [Flavihumibacter solisilvae]|uniref:C4-dicarboxylate ABC transporter n=1 Tax=Flavihumibacter solisilvae TaxID=1349421 RepID=A0A0C1ISC8_9BACT|nr:C4-dicarboxylate ABC transporter [Flavihumibacter solisilvae]
MRRAFKNRIKNLQFLPVSLFGSVMGIAGLSLSWRAASPLFGAPMIISTITGVTAIVIFAVLTVAYIIKTYLFRAKTSEEFHHPVVGNFFGTIPISVLLLSAVIRPWHAGASLALWLTGAVLTNAVAYMIITRLMKNKQDLLHATPAWLIPGVGTLDVAVTGTGLPYNWMMEINIFSFAVGSVLALVFFVLIISRLMHHDPMPERMTPSLIILIAPFAVGFLAFTNLIRDVNLFASVLFYFGIFLFLVLFTKVFHRNLPFMITWWAVGFPIAAISNASLRYAAYANSWYSTVLAGIMLGILSLLVLYIFIRSSFLLVKGRLLQA